MEVGRPTIQLMSYTDPYFIPTKKKRKDGKFLKCPFYKHNLHSSVNLDLSVCLFADLKRGREGSYQLSLKHTLMCSI